MATPVPTWVSQELVGTVQLQLLSDAHRDTHNNFTDLLGNNGDAVITGFALSSASGHPINFNTQAGTVHISGFRLPINAGNVTFNDGDTTNHRYDIVAVHYTNSTGTDSNGYPTSVDSATLVTITGTPSGTPVLPALPDATYVQVAWVDVPPGATAASQCTPHNVYGVSFYPFFTVAGHINASLLNSNVHGVQASGPGAAGNQNLALQDSSGFVYGSYHVGSGGQADGNFKAVNGVAFGSGYGGVVPDIHSDGVSLVLEANAGNIYLRPQGATNTNASLLDSSGRLGIKTVSPSYDLDVNGTMHASTGILGLLNDGGGTGRAFGTPGSITANSWVCAAADGSVGLAQAAQSLINGHKIAVGKSGNFTVPGQNGVTSWSVTLSDSSFTPNSVVATLNYVSGSIPTGGVFTWLVTGYSAGSVSGNVYGGSNNGETAFISVVAAN